MKLLQNNANVAEIESRLNKYCYLSKNTLPGSADGRVFSTLQSIKRYPDRKVNPNFYHWYILMKQFSHTTVAKWINDELYFDKEDSLINQFEKLYTGRKDNVGESGETMGSEYRGGKFEGLQETEYTIDITITPDKYDEEKMNKLSRLLQEYKAEMTEEENNNSKYIRIVCKIDPANKELFKEKVSKCIEYNNFSVRSKDVKGQKSLPLPVSQEKNE